MYVAVIDVRNSIQTSAINSIIKNELIKDPDEQERRITEIIDGVIIDAMAEIDGYLNKRYSTPLKPVPPIISKLCKDIAVYNLIMRVGIRQGSPEESYYNLYKQAIKYLESVAKGYIDIGNKSESASGSSTNTGEFRVKSSPRVFSRNSLRGL